FARTGVCWRNPAIPRGKSLGDPNLRTGCSLGLTAAPHSPEEDRLPRDRFSIITDGLPNQLPDIDRDETREWVESLDAAIDSDGRQRARSLMLKLLERARERQVGVPGLRSTDYINTIPPEREPWFPGDEDIERRIRAYVRWNAAIMVSRANKTVGVGG